MSKTIELRKILVSIFKIITDEVHFENVPEITLYPYLQYELNEILSKDGKTVFKLEVNILDYGLSTSTVEILSDKLQKALDKYYFINEKIQFTTYKLNKISVQEKDKKIRRRRLTFEIHLHELED
jgi:hypothetical protein